MSEGLYILDRRDLLDAAVLMFNMCHDDRLLRQFSDGRRWLAGYIKANKLALADRLILRLLDEAEGRQSAN